MNIRTVANRLSQLAEEIGCDTDMHVASTGSRYITIERRGLVVKIRVSDHQDAHATADYTCDGLEGTPAGARTYILAAMRTSEKAVRRLRRARRSAQARECEDDRNRWIVAYSKQCGISEAAAAAACPIKRGRA